MATDFYIKQADTAPPLVAILKDSALEAVDLTGSTVRFVMSTAVSATPTVDADAEILDAAAGRVQYVWQTGDTDVIGSYKAEFEVSWPDGTFETFPNKIYINVKVVADLGGVVT